MPSGRFPAPEHRAPFCSRVSRPCRAVLPRQLPAEDQSATKEQTELVFLALQQQKCPQYFPSFGRCCVPPALGEHTGWRCRRRDAGDIPSVMSLCPSEAAASVSCSSADV